MRTLEVTGRLGRKSIAHDCALLCTKRIVFASALRGPVTFNLITPAYPYLFTEGTQFTLLVKHGGAGKVFGAFHFDTPTGNHHVLPGAHRLDHAGGHEENRSSGPGIRQAYGRRTLPADGSGVGHSRGIQLAPGQCP